MNDEELKTFILEHLVAKSGKINPNYMKEKWWIDNKLDYSILEYINTLYPKYPNAKTQIQLFYDIVNDIKEIQYCEVCKKNPKRFYNFVQGYRLCCSSKCAKNHPNFNESRKKTTLEKYGVEHVTQLDSEKEKRKKTCLEKYGYEYALQVPEIKEKGKGVVRSKYGVDHVSQSPDIQTKKKHTLLTTWGFENLSNIPEVHEKKKENSLKRYGVEIPHQKHFPKESLKLLNDEKYLQKVFVEEGKTVKYISEELNVSVCTVSFYCKKFNIKPLGFYTKSLGEKELAKFLSEYLQVETSNRKIIYPFELDVFLPEKQVAIEYCGLYWHSNFGGKDKNYHRKKYELCRNKDIKLITLYEDEWNFNKILVKEKLKHILNISSSEKIYARKCEIVVLENDAVKGFFDKTHIQGDGIGSINYALIYNSEIVSCMLFKKRSEGVYELTRYSTNYIVLGGFQKLLTHFKKNNNWQEIITFADLRWHSGEVYEKSGFILDKTLLPDYEYVINGKRYHKFNFRHKGIKQKFPDKYDPLLTESENMDKIGIPKIYDCGKNRFIIKR